MPCNAKHRVRTCWGRDGFACHPTPSPKTGGSQEGSTSGGSVGCRRPAPGERRHGPGASPADKGAGHSLPELPEGTPPWSVPLQVSDTYPQPGRPRGSQTSLKKETGVSGAGWAQALRPLRANLFPSLPDSEAGGCVCVSPFYRRQAQGGTPDAPGDRDSSFANNPAEENPDAVGSGRRKQHRAGRPGQQEGPAPGLPEPHRRAPHLALVPESSGRSPQ